MKRGRKIVVYIATSADGYIARPDGDVAWLNRPRPAGNYGMASFFRSMGTIVWGRKTYEFALGMGGVGAYGLKVEHFVFSHRPPEAQPNGVKFVSEPVRRFAKQLRARAGKDIWIMGGASVIASFLDKGEVDEFIIHVIPVFIGEGIPLIQARHRLVRLALLSSRRFSDGVVRLHSSVAALMVKFA
jgi:dihydrofolate reductase